jgi:hypothetical protein
MQETVTAGSCRNVLQPVFAEATRRHYVTLHAQPRAMRSAFAQFLFVIG